MPTYRGQQSEPSLFTSMYRFLGAKRTRTTSYPLVANGMVERFHHQLKASISCYEDREYRYDNLPMIILGIRAAVKEDLDILPFELVYATASRLPCVLPSRRTFTIYCKSSRRYFLVNSGVDVSVLSPTQNQKSSKKQYPIFGANGFHNPTYGLQHLTLDIGLRRKLPLVFIVANVLTSLPNTSFLSLFIHHRPIYKLFLQKHTL